jgi:MerR family copper efflux transcriptional regulator
VNVETIRYYERRGLLPAPSRRASSYRQYSQDDVAYLRFIRRAKALEFSLKDIADGADECMPDPGGLESPRRRGR